MAPSPLDAAARDHETLDEAAAAHLLAQVRTCIAGDGPERPILERLLAALEERRLRLPVVPATLGRIMDLMGEAEVDLGELTYAVEMDPPLAAKVVGLANSAVLRGSEPVLSVHEALMRMGVAEARNLVVAVTMRSGVFDLPDPERGRALWEHAVTTAICCQTLLEDIPPWQDSGFLLGLVHDVGRVVMLSFLSEARRETRKLRRMEARVVAAAEDTLHAELGAAAVGSWAFPEPFVQAIRLHHEPDDAEGPEAPLTWALYAADTLAHLLGKGWEPGQSQEVDARVVELLAPLGLELDACARLLHAMEGGLSALMKLG